MKRELNVSQDLVERLFARLDDLVDIHLSFLQSLVRAQQCSTDKSIEAFGPLLLQQVRLSSNKFNILFALSSTLALLSNYMLYNLMSSSLIM